MYGKLYLKVPYAEKDEAKKFGARWNPELKLWYYDGLIQNYVNFSKWILGNEEDALIVFETLYILEGQRACWRCKKATTVIALGISEHAVISQEDGEKNIFIEEDIAPNTLIHLAWVDTENDIPPLLLRYLKKHYNVKTGYSNIAGKCFANHCEHCGAIQGNNYIMDEVDSPLTTFIADDVELKKRMEKLRIKTINIDENLQLNWNVRYCENDDAYYKYGSPKEIDILNDSDDWDYISYKEMYIL